MLKAIGDYQQLLQKTIAFQPSNEQEQAKKQHDLIYWESCLEENLQFEAEYRQRIKDFFLGCPEVYKKIVRIQHDSGNPLLL